MNFNLPQSPIEAEHDLKEFCINNPTSPLTKSIKTLLKYLEKQIEQLIKTQTALSNAHDIIQTNKIPEYENKFLTNQKEIKYWEDYSTYLQEIQDRLLKHFIKDDSEKETIFQTLTNDLDPPIPDYIDYD